MIQSTSSDARPAEPGESPHGEIDTRDVPTPPWQRRDTLTAVALFAVGLLLIGSGITWGLPHASSLDTISPWGSDELAPLGPFAQIVNVVLRGDAAFDPRYPLLPYLLFGAVEASYLLWLRITGGMAGMATEFPFGLRDPAGAMATLTLFARSLSLLAAAALPVVAYRTGALLRNRRTGTIAGALVLVLYTLSFYGRTSNVDMLGVLWSALGLMVFAACLRDHLTVRRAVALGIFAALATATKDQYYALFLGVGVIVVTRHLLAARRERWSARTVWWPIAAGFAAGLLVYLPASGLLINPERFDRHVQFIRGVSRPQLHELSYFSAPATPSGYLSLVGTAARLVANQMGIPAALAAVAGLAVAARRCPRMLLFALPQLAILIGVIFPTRFVRIRFLIITAWVGCLLAALALDALLERAERRRADVGPVHQTGSRMPARMTAMAVVVLVIGWSLMRVGDLTFQMLNDSRYAAAEWLRANARTGDRLGFYGGRRKLPRLEAGVVPVRAPWDQLGGTMDTTDLPEFIAVIPQQPHEVTHEWNVADSVYAGLLDGSRGYELVFAVQTPSLFPARVISWVNPPVRIFARRDRAAALPDSSRRLEIANPGQGDPATFRSPPISYPAGGSVSSSQRTK